MDVEWLADASAAKRAEEVGEFATARQCWSRAVEGIERVRAAKPEVASKYDAVMANYAARAEELKGRRNQEVISTAEPSRSSLDNDAQFNFQTFPRGDDKWRAVIGQKEAKLKLDVAAEAVTFVGAKPVRGVLMYGPPGNGKTMLAQAVAQRCGRPFVEVTHSDLLSKWHGVTQRNVANLFREAGERRAVVFIDEIDGLFSHRSAHDGDSSKTIRASFLTEWVRHDVLLIAATNHPDDLEEAFVRRFDELVHVGLPSKEDRAEMLRDVPLSDERRADFVEATEGLSASDLTRALRRAERLGRERAIDRGKYRLVDGAWLPCACGEGDQSLCDCSPSPEGPVTLPPPTTEDFESALLEARATSTTEDVARYSRW